MGFHLRGPFRKRAAGECSPGNREVYVAGHLLFESCIYALTTKPVPVVSTIIPLLLLYRLVPHEILCRTVRTQVTQVSKITSDRFCSFPFSQLCISIPTATSLNAVV